MKNIKRLGGLQSLRGIAAIAVLIQHITYYSCVAKEVPYQTFLKIDFGSLGVTIFFVISGFVMANCMSEGRLFFLNRILRIYPGFWLAVGVSFLLLASPVFHWTWDWKSLTLIPTKLNNSYRVPYWTLIYEMAFYFATYTMIVLGIGKAAVVRVCVVWLFLIVVTSKYLVIAATDPGAWILLGPLNVYFVIGMLFSLHYKDLQRIGTLEASLAGVVLWCAGSELAGAAPLASKFMFAASYCLLINLCVRHLKIPALEKLGDASYGIYLLHVPVATLAIHLITTQFPSISLGALWSSTMIIAFIGSMLFGVVETRMHVRAKKIAKSFRTAPAVANS